MSLKNLQKLWYQRLKEEGFKDIENTQLPEPDVKDWHGHLFKKLYTPERLIEQQDYYYYGEHMLNSHTFGSDLEKEIWALHIQGFSFRRISTTLAAKNIHVNKDKINGLIKGLRVTLRTQMLQDRDND